MWNEGDLGRPSGRNRRAMAKKVDAAVAAGRISALDRTALLHTINTTATRGELARVAVELARVSSAGHSAAYAPVPSPDGTQLPYTPPTSSRPGLVGAQVMRRRSGPGCLALLVVAGAIMVALIAGLVVAISSLTNLAPSVVDEPQLMTPAGLERLIDDVEAEFGTSEVVEVNLYEKYAMVVMPAEGSATRTITYQYDGDFDDVFTKGVRTPLAAGQPIDMSAVDVPAVIALIESTPAIVGLGDETVSHVAFRPGFGSDVFEQDQPSVYIHVNSDFGESGYVQCDLAGKIINTHEVAG